MSRDYRVELPPFALAYLGQKPEHHPERVVVLFHGWLGRNRVALAAVTPANINAFLDKPARKAIGRLTRNSYRYELRRYLRWLEERGLAGPFAADELEAYHRKRLPDEVRNYVRFLAPTHRPTTVRYYRAKLRQFHAWLDAQGIALAAVERTTCLGWAQHLHERGLHPSTRVGMLVAVRRYLEWLWERGILAYSGRDMVLPSDLPKKPEYLPRPLPPDTDKVLQERLKSDESPTALGLLLMRRTGLRLGELRRLQRDCIREDHGGQRHLKVPLGKLHNERLVPLDDDAMSAIAALQAQAPDDSPWLIAGARGRPIASATYAAALANAAAGIELSERLTSHRLRHTFATSLMSGGMSLPGIMKLLGHRDYRMTLRYTAIADETVGREYFEALNRLAERYELLRPESGGEVAADPVALINDVIRWTTKHLRGGALEREAKLVVRRLEAVRDEIESLKSRAPATFE